MLYFTDYAKKRVLGNQKQGFQLSIRKQFRPALLEISSNFYLGNRAYKTIPTGVYSDFDLVSIILSSLATPFGKFVVTGNGNFRRKDKKASRRFASSYTGSARG